MDVSQAFLETRSWSRIISTHLIVDAIIGFCAVCSRSACPREHWSVPGSWHLGGYSPQMMIRKTHEGRGESGEDKGTREEKSEAGKYEGHLRERR